MPFLYGPDGERWPLGRLCKVWETDFDGDALPSWMTTSTTDSDAGSSVAASALDPGGVVLTSAATANSTVSIYGPEIDLTTVTAVTLTATVTRGARGQTVDPNDGDGQFFRFGFVDGLGSTGALGAYHNNIPNRNAYLHVSNNTGVEQTAATIGFYDWNHDDKRHSVHFVLLAEEGMAGVGGPNDIGTAVASSVAPLTGTVRPRVWWYTNVAEAAVGHVHQLRVERWWR